METELLLIDKPHGITSFDVIRRLRRGYSLTHNGERAPKMGHAGTLDPLATGLMLIGLGKGTKKLAELIKLEKEYVAEIRIGERRVTGDMEGAVVEHKAVTETVREIQDMVRNALQTMLGEIELPVSAYSAIKVDGVPMYKRARKAEKTNDVVTDVPLRTMQVIESALQSVVKEEEYAVATVRFAVGSGTYIRSLAEELGNRIGYPATLQNLRRTKVGQYSIESAQGIENVFS